MDISGGGRALAFTGAGIGDGSAPGERISPQSHYEFGPGRNPDDDPEGNLTYWNPAAERLLGYPSAEALGRNLHDLLAPERYHEAHQAAFPGFFRTGQGAAVGKTLELHALRKDGREIAVALSLSSVRIGGGWHAVGILRDITELQQSEAKYKALFDGAGEGIPVVDLKTRQFRQANSALCSIWDTLKKSSRG